MSSKQRSHRAPRGSKSAADDLQTDLQTNLQTHLETAYGFFNEIGIISQLSSNQMQRAMPHDLTQSQFSVLNWFIRVDDQATPGRLAQAFQVTKGAMTNTLQKLQAKGFIDIQTDPASARRKIVTLTATGRRARDSAVAANYPQLNAFLDAFDIGRINRALPLLRQIRQYLDELRS